MTILYWVLFGIIIYTYIGYPLVLFLLQAGIKKKLLRGENRLPRVSLLIAAYNEEKVIQAKIDNCLMLDYPKKLLSIWVASDGSSDATNLIVNAYAKKHNNVKLLSFERTGKSGTLNKAMQCIDSEIVVFSDANTEYSTDVIKRLVSHFKDKDVGCVSGRLVYRNPGGITSGNGESLYWKIETALKKMESVLGYVAGANGAIYAIRKELFEPFPARTINDDFVLSMKIVMRGFKSLYDETAIVYEDVATTMESEFKRHVRDGAGHYIAVMHLLGLLNPFLGLRSFIYWSHRILRWVVPFLLLFLFIFNILLLDQQIYAALFVSQSIFYALAIIGWVFHKNPGLPLLLYAPFYFCNLNGALFLGFFKALLGKQKTTWDRTERITPCTK